MAIPFARSLTPQTARKASARRVATKTGARCVALLGIVEWLQPGHGARSVGAGWAVCGCSLNRPPRGNVSQPLPASRALRSSCFCQQRGSWWTWSEVP